MYTCIYRFIDLVFALSCSNYIMHVKRLRRTINRMTFETDKTDLYHKKRDAKHVCLFENLSCTKSSFVFIGNIENSIKYLSEFVTCYQVPANHSRLDKDSCETYSKGTLVLQRAQSTSHECQRLFLLSDAF